MLKKEDIVVFDFDGTLSAKDSNMEFGKYCFRHSLRPWLFLPVIGVTALVRLFNPGGMWWRKNMRLFMTAMPCAAILNGNGESMMLLSTVVGPWLTSMKRSSEGSSSGYRAATSSGSPLE